MRSSGHISFCRIFIILQYACFVYHFASIAEPNYVKTKVYQEAGGLPVVSKTYSDGLGRELQNHVHTGNETDLVRANMYDRYRRLEKTIKPFVEERASGAHTYLDIPDQDLLLKACLDHGGDSAYSNIEYHDDPLGRVHRAAAPGEDFTLTSGHGTEFYSWGVTTTENGKFATRSNYSSKGDETGSQYLLAITRDPDGNLSQAMSDIFGRTLKAWNHDGTNELIAGYTYDLLGNVLEETPPHPTDPGEPGAGYASTYRYDTRGRLYEKYTPDNGTLKYEYDSYGRLEKVINARHDVGDYLEYLYDDFDRMVEIREWIDGAPTTRIKNYYDDYIPLSAQQDFDGKHSICFAGILTNIKGRLVAEVSYGETGTERVISIYAYDKRGRLSRLFKVVPGLRTQKFEYRYDLQDKLVEERFFQKYSDTTPRFVKNHDYDELGRLKTISRGTVKMVEYVYNKWGQLERKDFFQSNGTATAEKIEYSYNIRDWVTRIASVQTASRFNEELHYVSSEFPGCGGSYVGNVAQTDYTIEGAAQTRIGYTYDQIHRLTDVASNQPEYNGAEYRYDNMGRLERKKEGGLTLDDYVYDDAGASKRNRLLGIVDASDDKREGTNYIYDPTGNMVLDRSKNMAVAYDWRDMPVRFTFYDNVPAGVEDWEDVKDMSGTVLNEVHMLYDAGGNRVKKKSRK